MPVTLCYWGVRGIAEPARYILRYSETEWNDNQKPPNMDEYQKYLNEEKPTLFDKGFHLPNLPFLDDGDVKLTQSIAIVRYLGRKFGLYPSNEQEQQRCEMAEQEIVDFRTAFGRLCYDKDFDTKKEEYLKGLEKKLSAFDRFLGDGPYVLGSKLTYVDFLIYEYLDQIKKLAPDHIKAFSNIVKAMTAFESLPTLQKWFNSEEYKAPRYINSPMSKFPGN